MSFLGRLFGTKSCDGMIRYPLFMKRKEKVGALDGMIKAIEKSTKKKRCDDCGRIFTPKTSRWGKDNLNSSICILCHKKFWNLKSKDYYFWSERNEIRKLKGNLKIQKESYR